VNLRGEMVLRAGWLIHKDFRARASAFGAGGADKLERLNLLLRRARAALPEYDVACAAALEGAAGLSSPGQFSVLPVMRRENLAGYAGGSALARLASGGTAGGDRFETRLDLSAVAARYAALLSVLKAAGWKMGDRTAALHPVEYSYFANLPAMLAGGQFGKVFFEFFQQYVLYRLVHNRVNVYYGGSIFSEPGAALALAEEAAAREPVLLITRPDALMAVLKSLRGGAGPRFKKLKAVLTVGTLLGESVRREARERLGAEVFNMYASTELGYAALSCPHSEGWLHADGAGHIVEAGADGEILCTDLDNALAPLLRYGTGDLGETASRGCLCGRAGEMLRLNGRKGKYAETATGRLYEAGVIDRVFPSDLPFFQLVPGSVLLPAGAGEKEAAAVRELLGVKAADYGAAAPGSFKISSSGKFCYLP